MSEEFALTKSMRLQALTPLVRSPVAQVLGHSKTIFVLLGGWAFLGDSVSGRKLAGMVLAVSGTPTRASTALQSCLSANLSCAA